MSKLSLAMIVKNEAKNLPQCLTSVQGIFDEMIIVDTGSTDNTIEVARKFTSTIHHFTWIHDFAAARNFAFSRATGDYIMWLDADDILTNEDAAKLRMLKQKLSLDTTIDVITAPYNCTFDSHGNVTLQSVRERIISNKYFATHKWEGVIHESIPWGGTIHHADFVVTHSKNHEPADINSTTFKRNFDILNHAIKSGNHQGQPRIIHYYACSLKELGRLDDALKWLQVYFTHSNIDPNAYLTAFDIYLAKGDTTAAFKVLTDNQPACSHMSEYYTALGQFFYKYVGDNHRAAEAYLAALKCPGDTNRTMDYYYFLPYAGLAELATVSADYKKALEYYQNAQNYKHDPNIKSIVEKLHTILQASR